MTSIREFYKPMFRSWQAKHLGPQPTDEMLERAHAFGRPGKQSLALAMTMRPEGATAGQIVQACGAPQNNHRRHVVEKGWFKREPASASAEGHTVYKVTLSKKGEAKLATVTAKAAADADKAGEAPVKATKGKVKAKATKRAKAKPATTNAPVTPEADAVTPANEPVTTADAPQADATA